MVCGQERKTTLAHIRSGSVLVCAAFLVALVLASAVTADVWDDYDYPGQKRKLKVWIRGAGGIPGFAAAVQAAMDNWNGTSGDPPRDNNGAWELVPGTEADHDVDIGGKKMDGAGGTLGDTGFTDADGDGVAEGGSDINIDNQENWGPGADQHDLERAIKHELGHAQRMDDTAMAGDLMNGGQAAGNHNVTPSGHDQDEARASYWDNMLIDILPEMFRKGMPTLCSITGPGMNLQGAVSVSITPVDPSHLQVSNVMWNPTQIRATFFAMPPSLMSQGAWHNEGFSIDVRYMDNSTATFGSFVTATDTDPIPDHFPHANAGPDVVSWIGHTFTLHGCGSYHDDPAYTDSLVHVWKWATQPGLPGGGAQTEMLSRAIGQPGTYTFALEVEDLFTQKSTDTVTVTVNPYPPAGTDCFDVTANVTLIDPTGAPHPVTLSGPVSVRRSAPWDNRGLLTIDTEIVSMSLTGFDPAFGEVRIGLHPPSPCLGKIKMPSPGVWYPADSFFDVFCEFSIGNDPPLHNSTADHLIVPGGINGLPFPDGTVHQSTSTGYNPLDHPDGSTTQWSYTGLKITKLKSSIEDPRAACGDAIVSMIVRNTATNEVETVSLKGNSEILWTSTGNWDASQFVDFHVFGMSPLLGGSVRVVSSSELSSMGRIKSQTPGIDFPADSFFDVFVEVQLPSLGSLHNCSPIRISGVINALPMPVGAVHEMAPGMSIPLLDANGVPTDYVIESFRHIIGPWSDPYSIVESYGVTGAVTYRHPTTGLSNTPVDGTIVIKRNPNPPLPDPIPIEIVGLSLQSVEPITVVVSGNEPHDRVSKGTLLPRNPGSQWSVDSFFDIFTELSLSDGINIRNCEPVYLRSDAPVNGLPFAPGTSFSKAWLSPPVAMSSNGLSYGEIEDMHLIIGDPGLPVASPAAVKSQPAGTSVALSGPIVSSFFDVFFYVQTPLAYPPDPGRPGISGIRVDWPFMPEVGDEVLVQGTVRVRDGEARIAAANVERLNRSFPPSPFFFVNRALGGAAFGLQPAVGLGVGLNNTGLLVRVFGKIAGGDMTTHILIDDGSGMTTNGQPGVKCYLPAGCTVPASARYATVTGENGAELDIGGVPVPVIRSMYCEDLIFKDGFE